jgi:RNA polymerase sigma-70 factor (ECF subfamily)
VGAPAADRASTLPGIGEGDDDLVTAAQQGDRGALEALLRAHHDRLYAVCRRLTGNDADAADATQETLISVVRGLAGFDRRSRFTTWTYRIAVNASLDELRRRRRRPQPVLDDDDAGGGSLGQADRSNAQADGTEGSADRLDIDAALRRLAPEFRAAVVLRDLCGLDYAEIAEVLDIPPGTVRSRIARGRAALVPLVSGNPAAPAQRPRERP